MQEMKRAIRTSCTERKVGIWTLLVCALLAPLGFVGCAGGRSNKPTPDAAKRFLKLRGYEFNDKSFLAAAAANDVAAVKGFLARGSIRM